MTVFGTEYDLNNEADVRRLAAELGQHWSNAIVPLSAATAEELRGILFGYFFAGPFGAMTRAIGVENARAVVEVLLKAADTAAEERKRAAH